MKLTCAHCHPDAPPQRTALHLLDHLHRAHDLALEDALANVLSSMDVWLDRQEKAQRSNSAGARSAQGGDPTSKSPPLPDSPARVVRPPPAAGWYWRCVPCGAEWSGPFTSGRDLRLRADRHVASRPDPPHEFSTREVRQ